MKRNTIIIVLAFMLFLGAFIQSCVSAKIADKGGSQLWTENCQRCHNAPSSAAFSNMQWELVMAHMKTRATLTDDQYKKILEFLKAGD
ncbi:cytochrome c [Flavitalea flava]